MKRVSTNQENEIVSKVFDLYLENNPDIDEAKIYETIEEAVSDMVEQIHFVYGK